MIRTIAIREFLSNIKTFRFAVCFTMTVVLGVLVSYVAVEDYEREMKEYAAARAYTDDLLDNIRVWMELKPTVYKRPEPFSIFAQGISRKVVRAATVRLGRVPELASVGQVGNPFLSIFPPLDVLLVVKVILGLLVLLLGFDAVSGEREHGTLALVLSNPVPRSAFLIGKILGAMCSLSVAAVAGGLVGLLVFLQSPLIALSAGEWLRCGMIFFCAFLYLSLFYLLALTILCRTRRSGTALGITILIWAVLLVVVPNLAAHVAAEFRPPPPKRQIEAQIQALRQELKRELERSLPPRVDGTETGAGYFQTGGSIPGPIYGAVTRPLAEYYKRASHLDVSLRIRYAKRIWEVSRRRFDALVRQGLLSRRLALLSPGIALEECVAGLAGTHLTAYVGFIKAVQDYRKALERYVHGRTNGFSTLSYFTPASEEEIDEFTAALEAMERDGVMQWLEQRVAQIHQEYEEMGRKTGIYDAERRKRLRKEARDKARMRYIGRWHYRKKEDHRPLDLRGLPRFEAPKPGIWEVLQSKADAFGMLLLSNVVLFFAAGLSFLRYDVRP